MSIHKLVAGVDSSTQSCKIVIRDLKTGALVRSGSAKHGRGTEINPYVWRNAFDEAVKQAGGLDDVVAISIAGQQHGMVALGNNGNVVRDAILWNDTRSAIDAYELINEFGNGSTENGKLKWAKSVGSVPVASLTITKLRWMNREEPDNLKRTAAIALPHDWLTWVLKDGKNINTLTTDRSEASGTGYFSSEDNEYKRNIISMAAGDDFASKVVLPRVVGPHECIGESNICGVNMKIGPGAGDNAAAALGLGLKPGEVVLSIGTSGVVSLVSKVPIHDSKGYVTGFADATGNYLPLVCTLNASRVIDSFRQILHMTHEEFSHSALCAPPGSEGLVVLPYFEGERTPNLPDATGAIHGVTCENFTPSNIARAAIEGMLCGVGVGIKAMTSLGMKVNKINLIGGGAQSEAVRRIAPCVLGLPVSVPEYSEYVADGASKQAAWVYCGGSEPPEWVPRLSSEYIGDYVPFIAERFNEVSERFITRSEAVDCMAIDTIKH